ncbi:restriction endonuclease [Listeria monocytogenes]|nr:restriction endonuclease [Listeria monocytogenes]
MINNIHKYNKLEYSLIRLTRTMVKKNNIDANGLFRDLLKTSNLVDYNKLQNGGTNGIKYTAKLLLENHFENMTMNFYKVKGDRSDPRFSIHGIKSLLNQGKMNIDDLLYITVTNPNKDSQIVILNLTSNISLDKTLKSTFGADKTEETLSRLIPEIRRIAQAGFHPNSKGEGPFAPKDVGDTLEYLLGIKTNNSQKADYEENIEIKAKTGKTMDTLFTLRPRFEGTLVEQFEKSDRNRVSAFARLYGYESDKHVGYKNLYITIGTKKAPQNKIGFFLEINEEKRTVEIRKWNEKGNHEITAFWTFDSLRKELHTKHPATLWVKAEQRVIVNTVEFKYFEADLSREPQFTTFLSLIETGGITYDWRGFTTPSGKYQGKNHGNAWRIKKKYRNLLFGSVEKIELL